MNLRKKLIDKIESKKYTAIRKLVFEAANSEKYSIDLLRYRFDDYAFNRFEKDGLTIQDQPNNYIRLSWEKEN